LRVACLALALASVHAYEGHSLRGPGVRQDGAGNK